MNADHLPNEVNGSGPEDLDRLVIRSPEDLIAAVPYLLGFHPENSLVAVGTHGPHGTMVLRLDLARGPEEFATEQVAARIIDVLCRNDFGSALLVGYGSDEQVTEVITLVRQVVTDRGVTVREALRVNEGRWWSYVCAEPRCCPPDGTPYDHSTSVVAACATVAGHVALADRDELVRSVAPLNGHARLAMGHATDRAEKRFLRPVADLPDVDSVGARMVAEGVPLIKDLLQRARSGGDPATDDEIARLGVVLTHIRVRDEAWVRIDEDHPQDDIAFWRDVLRRVEPRYAAAPGCLLAYAAYSNGDGGLANVALERAAEADPGYSMTRLLRDVISYGVPPGEARVRMTPEELAAAYRETSGRDTAGEP